MTSGRAGAIALAAVLTLGACGTTYIDPDVTVAPTVEFTTTTSPAVDPGTPVPELLVGIEALMRHLDEQIVDEDGQAETMARIDELWQVAEQRIRDRDPDLLYPFQQAIDLARTGVDRRRPADASKAYKILVAAIDAYAD